MQALREHATRDMGVLPDGTPYLPMLKPGSGQHHWNHEFRGTPPPWQRVNPGTATWALAHAVYPGELFAADDPLVQNFCALLDQIDDAEVCRRRQAGCRTRRSGPAASFYAHVWLYAGRPDKAVDYLYAFANHAAPTRLARGAEPGGRTPRPKSGRYAPQLGVGRVHPSGAQFDRLGGRWAHPPAAWTAGGMAGAR
ncbi:MAG: hypothetical protein R2854_10665 [Caldilineaceae bacterium]